MPAQVAPFVVSASAPPPVPAPLRPIPEYRLRLFSEGVGERLRESAALGIPEAQVLQAIRSERLALAAALNEPAFAEAFAQAYAREHAKLQPQFPLSIEASRAATAEIIANRTNDARMLAALTGDAEFIAVSRAEAARPGQRRPFQLAPEKIAEMIEHFATDGTTHAQQSMLGHRVGHEALARVYSKQGGLHDVLAQALARHWPQAADADRARLAADWLEAREQPARATEQTLREGGDVYNAVLARIEHAKAHQPGFAARMRTRQLAANELMMDRL